MNGSAWVISAFFGLSACRIGTSDVDPLDLVEPVSDAGKDAASAGEDDEEADPSVDDSAAVTTPTAAGAGSPSAGTGGSSPTSSTEASSSPASGTTSSADDDAGTSSGAIASPTPGADPATPVAGDACSARVEGCDPVDRTGCVDLIQMQCVIDHEASVPTGMCVFPDRTTPDAGQCGEDIVRTTCSAGQGCFKGECRTICKCDAQCGAGSCCNLDGSPKAGNVLKYCGACS
ncbi:MAG: hypothetical protein RL385_3403 [Pseudomonadota bacterium]|jgi:hypothetical protein